MIYINGQQIERQSFTWVLRTEVVAPNTPPTFWRVNSVVFNKPLEDALAVTNPAQTQGFTDVTDEYLPENWNTDAYKKDITDSLSRYTKDYVENIFDSSSKFGLISLKTRTNLNEVAMAAISAYEHWEMLCWKPQSTAKAMGIAGFYIDEHTVMHMFNNIPEIPIKFYHVQYLALGVGPMPLAENDPLATEAYYTNWITNNPL